MIYETIVGIGTILFLIVVWVLLMKPVTDVIVTFNNITHSSRFNVSVNQTEISEDYSLGEDVAYFSLFFIVIVIIAWIIKVSVYQQRRRQLFGG